MITNLIHIGKFSTKSKLKFPITVTNNAWQKINDILKSNNDVAMIFSAEGGGCNGFNYKLNPMQEIDFKMIQSESEKVKPSIINNGDSKILIEPLSEMLLLGTTIDYIKEDYQKGIYESKFVFVPDKKFASSCGCGISFNIK